MKKEMTSPEAVSFFALPFVDISTAAWYSINKPVEKLTILRRIPRIQKGWIGMTITVKPDGIVEVD